MTRRRWIADEFSGNHAALTGDHAPDALGGEAISESELEDLIAYLKSL